MGRHAIDMTSFVFGKVTVLERDFEYAGNNAAWKCKCQCGQMFVAEGIHLRRGSYKSCGCEKGINISEMLKQIKKPGVSKSNRERGKLPRNGKRNGASKKRLFSIWTGMRSRCNFEYSPSYHNYGGRGIKVCSEWESSYECFEEWAIHNGYKDDLQIDRLDNDGDYCPSNCRWVTITENSNNRRTNRSVEFNGEYYTIAQLARKLGVKYSFLYFRLGKGMSMQEILKELE